MILLDHARSESAAGSLAGDTQFKGGRKIDVEGLAYVSGSSTVSWTQKTSGATASGVLTVKEGAQTQSFTLVGSYTTSNFSVTSDGHGGTLITDPPVTGGGTVVTSAGTGSGSSDVDTAQSSANSVISGGYELGTSGGTAGDTNSGGTDVFFSGGGMVQLDALLAQFAGVISGFDLGDGLDLGSLGFGSSWFVVERHALDALDATGLRVEWPRSDERRRGRAHL
jgi:hypothetical protein